jgi:hypothetical protein
MLHQSRTNLDNATAIFERGRIGTSEQAIIKTVGPWSVTTLFNTKRLSLMWFIRQARTPHANAPCPTLHLPDRVIYIGMAGKIRITVGNEYTTLAPGRECSVDSFTEHSLEPLDRRSEVVQVLVRTEE